VVVAYSSAESAAISDEYRTMLSEALMVKGGVDRPELEALSPAKMKILGKFYQLS
jgi:hypothetical protein